MPVVVNYPNINGHYYSASSVGILIRTPTVPLFINPAGVKTLTYAVGLTPGDVMGLSPQKAGRTRGTASDEASIELYEAQFEVLRLALGNIGFLEVPFDIVVTIFEPPSLGNAVPMTTDPLIHTILGARITKASKNGISSGSTDATSFACELNVMRVLLGPMQPGAYPQPMAI